MDTCPSLGPYVCTAGDALAGCYDDATAWDDTTACSTCCDLSSCGTEDTVPSPAYASASTELSCTAVSDSVDDDWCNANCNHVPPNCPSDFCTCVDDADDAAADDYDSAPVTTDDTVPSPPPTTPSPMTPSPTLTDDPGNTDDLNDDATCVEEADYDYSGYDLSYDDVSSKDACCAGW